MDSDNLRTAEESEYRQVLDNYNYELRLSHLIRVKLYKVNLPQRFRFLSCSALRPQALGEKNSNVHTRCPAKFSFNVTVRELMLQVDFLKLRWTPNETRQNPPMALYRSLLLADNNTNIQILYHICYFAHGVVALG